RERHRGSRHDARQERPGGTVHPDDQLGGPPPGRRPAALRRHGQGEVMQSSAITAALEAWRQGYSPTDAARKHLRSLFRAELEGEFSHLAARLEVADELQSAAIAREFAGNVARLEARLRRNLSR